MIVVIGIVERNGLYLIGQRASGPLKDRWEFPGGKVEPGETTGGALVRELREEVGIDVTRIDEIPLRVCRNPFDERVTLAFFRVRRFYGLARPIVHVGLTWQPLDKLPDYNLIDNLILDVLRTGEYKYSRADNGAVNDYLSTPGASL